MGRESGGVRDPDTTFGAPRSGRRRRANAKKPSFGLGFVLPNGADSRAVHKADEIPAGAPLLTSRRLHREFVEQVSLCAWDFLFAFTVIRLFGLAGGGPAGIVRTAALGVAAVVAIGLLNGYRRTDWLHAHPLRGGRKLVAASAILSWLVALVAIGRDSEPRLQALLFAWLVTAAGWFVARRIAAVARSNQPERVLVVGNGDVASRVLTLSRRRKSPIVVIGCLGDSPTDEGEGQPDYLGPIGLLPELLANGMVDRVVVAFTRDRDHDILRVLRDSIQFQCPVDIVPRFFDYLGTRPPQFYHADGLAFLSVPGYSLSHWRTALKRLVDVVGSAALLLLTAPLFIAIAIAILQDSGRPILFRQQRAGLRGRRFTILKFRTLQAVSAEEAAARAAEMANAGTEDLARFYKDEAQSRATRVGSFLRKTSLDELPQIINVLKGDMSLIGPRPLPLPEFELCSGWQLRRQEMRPGITGLWQVSGRSETTWQKRMELDHSQVHHWSLWSDLEILADTVPALVSHRGAT
jgi:exopolysaccharide biosynthesis polyprenyl glycosylphosphotransferase